MTDLVPFRGGLARREEKVVGRGLARLRSNGQLELAKIDQEIDLSIAAADALAEIGGEAMRVVTRAAVQARQLIAMEPAAGDGIETIYKSLVINEMGVVDAAARRLRR